MTEAPLRYAIVGRGWRAQFFLRLAALMPERFAVTSVVTRTSEGAAEVGAQVCSTHGYHAVSMLRGMLGVGYQPATVCGHAFAAPLADPLSPAGWSADATPGAAVTTIATLDFGGRMGLYDFTANQWWNPLRTRRIVVRGTTGELVDDRLVRLVDAGTPVESALRRRQTGRDLNLEGADLDHISLDGAVIWRNPYFGARLSDEDIAIATMLERTGRWARDGGEAPYPLAAACQDHLLSLAIEESARTGRRVTTGSEPWVGS